MIVLIDTCVIVDALQNRKPFADYAKKIFLSVAEERFTGFITAKSVTDIYYITHKLTHSDEETRKILNKLFSLFNIADTFASDCLDAIHSDISDYEDAVMTETAKRIKADFIVTENIKDFVKSDVPCVTAKKFIKNIIA